MSEHNKLPDTIQDTTKLSLKDFPPILRKIASNLVLSEDNISLAEVCRMTHTNYSSVISALDRCRKKGKDFYALVNDNIDEKLKSGAYRIKSKIFEKGLEDSYKDRELYLKMYGFITETVQHKHQHIHLHHCAPLPAQMPIINVEEEED